MIQFNQVKDNINIVIVIIFAIVIVSVFLYMFFLEKEKPSSIDDFITKVQKSKSPAAAQITSKNLKKLEVAKVKTIDTKDPFNYSKKNISLPRIVSGVTSGLSLKDVSFVGILDINGMKYAFLRLPDKRVYKFTEGEYITKEAAKIYSIDETQMVLIVNAQDSRGSWITDKRVLKLNKQKKENL